MPGIYTFGEIVQKRGFEFIMLILLFGCLNFRDASTVKIHSL